MFEDRSTHEEAEKQSLIEENRAEIDKLHKVINEKKLEVVAANDKIRFKTMRGHKMTFQMFEPRLLLVHILVRINVLRKNVSFRVGIYTFDIMRSPDPNCMYLVGVLHNGLKSEKK